MKRLNHQDLVRKWSQNNALQQSVQAMKERRSPSAQHAVSILPDTSGSMRGEPISLLNQAINEFFQQIASDRILAASLSVGVFGFSTNASSYIEEIIPFSRPGDIDPPVMKANTGTPHCARLIEGVAMMSAFSNALSQELDADCRHGWIIDITDGEAMDKDLHEEAIHASQVTAVENGIEIFFFGCGDASLPYLNTLAQPGRPAELLKDIKDFKRLFRWLFKSVRTVSQSMVGDEVLLEGLYDDSPEYTSGGDEE